jgi:hypothetical protein
MIALTRQVCRGERNDVIPGRSDDAAVECHWREPIDVAVGTRAKLRCRNQTLTEQAKRDVRQPSTAIRRREEHDTTELSRLSHRKRTPYNDGAHAVADEMEPLHGVVLIEFLCFSRKPRRMRLDGSPQASIAPVYGAKPLSL